MTGEEVGDVIEQVIRRVRRVREDLPRGSHFICSDERQVLELSLQIRNPLELGRRP